MSTQGEGYWHEVVFGAAWIRWLDADAISLIHAIGNELDDGRPVYIDDTEVGSILLERIGGLDAPIPAPTEPEDIAREVWIAKATGLQPARSLREHLRQLEQLGLIRCVLEPDGAVCWTLVRPTPMPEEVLNLSAEQSSREHDVRWHRSLQDATRAVVGHLVEQSKHDTQSTTILELTAATGLDSESVRQVVADTLRSYGWEPDVDVAQLGETDRFSIAWAPTDLFWSVPVWNDDSGHVTVTLAGLSAQYQLSVSSVRRGVLRVINGDIFWTSHHVADLDPHQPFELHWDWSRNRDRDWTRNRLPDR